METVSLSQIFDADLLELENTLQTNLFPTKTQYQINQELSNVYCEYRKQLITRYYQNNKYNLYPQLDKNSVEIVSNKHFFPAMISSNYTLQDVLNDIYNKTHRLGHHASMNDGDGRHHDPNEYYDSSSNLSEENQKYCRTVLHVAAKQDDWCLEGQNWQKTNPQTGTKCYNPYAIASQRVPRSGRPECLKDLKLDSIPEEELRAEASLHKMTIDELRRKQKQMLQGNTPSKSMSYGTGSRLSSATNSQLSNY
jgi:hypothetical protein